MQNSGINFIIVRKYPAGGMPNFAEYELWCVILSILKPTVLAAGFMWLWLYLCGKTIMIGTADIIWILSGVVAVMALIFTQSLMPEIEPGVPYKYKELYPYQKWQIARYVNWTIKKGKLFDTLSIFLPLSTIALTYVAVHYIGGVPYSYTISIGFIWLLIITVVLLFCRSVWLKGFRETPSAFYDVGVSVKPQNEPRWLVVTESLSLFLACGFVFLLPSLICDSTPLVLLDWLGPIFPFVVIGLIAYALILPRRKRTLYTMFPIWFIIWSLIFFIILFSISILLIGQINLWITLGLIMIFALGAMLFAKSALKRMYPVEELVATIIKPWAWQWIVSLALIFLISVEGYPRLQSIQHLMQAGSSIAFH